MTATPTPSATPTPTPEATTPLPGWVASGAPCGAAYALERGGRPSDRGAGRRHHRHPRPPDGGASHPTPRGPPCSSTSSGRRASRVTAVDLSGPSQLTTMLVDDSGTVAFWSEESRMLPQFQAADGLGASMYSMWDAVDCRTGRPLVGTYRVFAHQAAGPETVELAPVTFGPDGTRPPDPFLDRLPVCGQPLPDVAPDFTVALDPGVVAGPRQPGGLHAPVTVTRTGAGRLQGRVPQSMHAVLVHDGVVVSQADDPISSLRLRCHLRRRRRGVLPRRGVPVVHAVHRRRPHTGWAAPGHVRPLRLRRLRRRRRLRRPVAPHGRRRPVPAHRAVAVGVGGCA